MKQAPKDSQEIYIGAIELRNMPKDTVIRSADVLVRELKYWCKAIAYRHFTRNSRTAYNAEVHINISLSYIYR